MATQQNNKLSTLATYIEYTESKQIKKIIELEELAENIGDNLEGAEKTLRLGFGIDGVDVIIGMAQNIKDIRKAINKKVFAVKEFYDNISKSLMIIKEEHADEELVIPESITNFLRTKDRLIDVLSEMTELLFRSIALLELCSGRILENKKKLEDVKPEGECVQEVSSATEEKA